MLSKTALMHTLSADRYAMLYVRVFLDITAQVNGDTPADFAFLIQHTTQVSCQSIYATCKKEFNNRRSMFRFNHR